MDQKVLDFLAKEKVCVLAVILPDGFPHTATMHFAHQDGSIYLSTRSTSKKASNLSSGNIKASITVGISEEEWVTVQMDGQLEKVEDKPAKSIILAKYPDDEKHFDATAIFLKFTPTWWRYSDFKSTPPIFLASE